MEKRVKNDEKMTKIKRGLKMIKKRSKNDENHFYKGKCATQVTSLQRVVFFTFLTRVFSSKNSPFSKVSLERGLKTHFLGCKWPSNSQVFFMLPSNSQVFFFHFSQKVTKIWQKTGQKHKKKSKNTRDFS